LKLTLEPVPWCPTGFWIGQRNHELGNSVAHFQGLFYLEDAASLLPPEALTLSPESIVLDAAAAPGGKTTHISALMGNTGAVVANEVDSHRMRVLRFNLSRMGTHNAAVTTLDMTKLSDIGPIFEKVLLDAPCSCEGRIGGDVEELKLWKPARVLKCSRLQEKLIENCFSLLTPGGTLVYSTCTLAPEENEGIVDALLKKHGDADIEEIITSTPKYAEGVTEWRGKRYDNRVAKCIRLYPHHHKTQGFFVARIKKCY